MKAFPHENVCESYKLLAAWRFDTTCFEMLLWYAMYTMYKTIISIVCRNVQFQHLMLATGLGKTAPSSGATATDTYFLPNSSRVNRLWLGWVFYFSFLYGLLPASTTIHFSSGPPSHYNPASVSCPWPVIGKNISQWHLKLFYDAVHLKKVMDKKRIYKSW